MALATIAGCAGFGAVSGSSLATAATMGQIGLPEMRRRGYSSAFAAGSVAAGGTLGSLTPPSGALIVFGIIADAFVPLFDKDAVRWALFVFSIFALWGAWHYWIAPRTLKDDLERAAKA